MFWVLTSLSQILIIAIIFNYVDRQLFYSANIGTRDLNIQYTDLHTMSTVVSIYSILALSVPEIDDCLSVKRKSLGRQTILFLLRYGTQ